MTITAKFASICPTCQTGIAVGVKVEWAPGSKAKHVSCPVVTISQWEQTVGRSAQSEQLMAVRKAIRGSYARTSSYTGRGRRTGCSCGSIEGQVRSSDCRSCQHDEM